LVGSVQLLAVDPGDVHNGTGLFELKDYALTRKWTRAWSPGTLYHYLERVPEDTIIVCESFHLYPELAREQGYSTFPTCERIGAVKYIASRRGLTLYMQEPSTKRKARRIGERLRSDLGSIRMIGTGRSRYRGWDWDAPTQHERDATCHGAFFAFRNKNSPLFERDLKRTVALEWLT
jgi:hypothetical protein